MAQSKQWRGWRYLTKDAKKNKQNFLKQKGDERDAMRNTAIWIRPRQSSVMQDVPLFEEYHRVQGIWHRVDQG